MRQNFSNKLILALALLFVPLFSTSLAVAQPVTVVQVAGKASGYLPLPCNCIVEVVVAAHAVGSPVSLVGSGMNHATTGSTNHYTLSGATDGTVVQLWGSVIMSTVDYLEGSQVNIIASAETGALEFKLTPKGGPFAGQLLIFIGEGHITVEGH